MWIWHAAASDSSGARQLSITSADNSASLSVVAATSAAAAKKLLRGRLRQWMDGVERARQERLEAAALSRASLPVRRSWR